MKKEPKSFDSLSGTTVKFHGCDADNFRFKIGKTVYEVVQDGDGYRSYLTDVRPCSGFVPDLKTPVTVRVESISSRLPIIRTEKDAYTNIDDGYRLVGTDNHIWLEFGTDNEDEYYPSFVFSYNPKKKKGKR